MMKERPFGNETRTVSEIGLGTWQLGGDWGSVTDRAAEEILQTAVDHGVTFFDTADVYGGGVSEQRIARFLKQHDGNVFVATKLGRSGDPGWPENFTMAAMRQHTEDSLRRLQVEALDLTQLHCIPTDELRRGDVFDHLRTFQREGKIKRFWCERRVDGRGAYLPGAGRPGLAANHLQHLPPEANPNAV
jgi:aryl-alcohol dehydrogenase-like predicted oxidoreductase